MFDFALAGLSNVARLLAAGLGSTAHMAFVASALAAAASTFGEAGALLLGERSEGLHVREGWDTLACSTLTCCTIACCEGAVWHRRGRTALAVHVQLRSRTVTQCASGSARLSMCRRLSYVDVHDFPCAEVYPTRVASFDGHFFEPLHQYKCCRDKRTPFGPIWAWREDAAGSVLNDCAFQLDTRPCS